MLSLYLEAEHDESVRSAYQRTAREIVKGDKFFRFTFSHDDDDDACFAYFKLGLLEYPQMAPKSPNIGSIIEARTA